MSWVYDDTKGQNRFAWAWNSNEAINNYWQMYHYFVDSGKMTVQALCGILGNVAHESQGNPWQEQVNSPDRGFGLIQWTPPSSLTSVYHNQYPTGDEQCLLIWNEIIDNQVWTPAGRRFYPNHGYNYDAASFCALTDEAEAARAYFWERVRGTNEAIRVSHAQWILSDVFGGQPQPPTPPSPSPDNEDVMWWALKLLRIVQNV